MGTRLRAAIIAAGRLAIVGLAVAAGPPLGAEPAYQETPGEPPSRAASDRSLLDGYRRYNASCNHCHGPDGAGSSFGPSLIASLAAPDAFRQVVAMGSASGTSVMKGFAGDPNIEPYIGDIYAYLRARADGSIGRGRPRARR